MAAKPLEASGEAAGMGISYRIHMICIMYIPLRVQFNPLHQNISCSKPQKFSHLGSPRKSNKVMWTKKEVYIIRNLTCLQKKLIRNIWMYEYQYEYWTFYKYDCIVTRERALTRLGLRASANQFPICFLHSPAGLISVFPSTLMHNSGSQSRGGSLSHLRRLPFKRVWFGTWFIQDSGIDAF